MTWLHMLFGLFFYSSRQPSQIGPTADFDGAAIPPLYFPCVTVRLRSQKTLVRAQVGLDAVGLGGPRGGTPKAHERTRLVGFGSEQAYWIFYSKLDYRLSPLN